MRSLWPNMDDSRVLLVLLFLSISAVIVINIARSRSRFREDRTDGPSRGAGNPINSQGLITTAQRNMKVARIMNRAGAFSRRSVASAVSLDDPDPETASQGRQELFDFVLDDPITRAVVEELNASRKTVEISYGQPIRR